MSDFSSRRASADEAVEMNLINRVFADETFDEDVMKYVSVYQTVSRSAVVLSKKLLYQIDGMTFETALQAGVDVNTIARMTGDCQKGIAKFLEK